MSTTSRNGVNSRSARELGFVIALALAEFAFRAAINPFVGDRHQYLPAYAAIGTATWFCGWRAGTITALACLLSGQVFAPLSALDGTMAHEVIAHTGYAFVSAAVISLVEWARREWLTAAGTTADLRETDRRRSQAMAHLTHELRNPLSSIVMGSKMLASGLDPEAAHLTLRMLERQAQHMARLVNDLCDADHLRTGEFSLQREMVDLAAAVQEAVLAARSATDPKQQRIEVFCCEQAGAAFADPGRLHQILDQLLRNASRYSPDGTAIQVSVSAKEHWVNISVEDTGVGLAPAELARIFEPFVRLRHDAGHTRGLGLGLTIARGLAQVHGGTLRAFSGGTGRGSEFVLTLPRIVPVEQAIGAEQREEVAPPGPSRSPPRDHRAAAKLRILVIDDDADGAATLALLLQRKGHQTLIALNGSTALEIAAREHPQLVFVDIGLPDMSGLQVATRLRELLGPETTLVALTGWSRDEDLARSRVAGLDAHLTKPVDPTAIEQVLALLGCAAQPRGARA